MRQEVEKLVSELEDWRYIESLADELQTVSPGTNIEEGMRNLARFKNDSLKDAFLATATLDNYSGPVDFANAIAVYLYGASSCEYSVETGMAFVQDPEKTQHVLKVLGIKELSIYENKQGRFCFQVEYGDSWVKKSPAHSTFDVTLINEEREHILHTGLSRSDLHDILDELNVVETLIITL